MPETPDVKKIRIATSIPSLKNKIQTKLDGDLEVVYWYIKFNIPLDASTVTHKTMGVTDTSGYIMRTDITYDDSRNLIVISPLDTYEQNRYYLLKISKKVRSEKGQQLRSAINILFKLMNNQISEYKILKKNVQVPPSKTRPKDYNENYTRSKVYSFDGSAVDPIGSQNLPSADLDVNIWGGVIGLLLTIPSVILGNIALTVLGITVCVAGLFHMFSQLSKARVKSLRFYNRGARNFNRGKYEEAKLLFQRAVMHDDTNEYAEYGLYKVEFYLSK